MGVRNLKAAGSSGVGSTLSDQLSVLEFIRIYRPSYIGIGLSANFWYLCFIMAIVFIVAFTMLEVYPVQK